MAEYRETFQGYVVDLACLRSDPQGNLFERARKHTVECALMGHCIESGYGLVDEKGTVVVLDPEATGGIVRALNESNRKEGMFLRVEREQEGHRMKTVRVTEASPKQN